ncbi:MAG TPA: hypothetical protein PK224_09300 [Nitrospira sp.]|nr:hypothetical protein [Nitrospira sp.]
MSEKKYRAVSFQLPEDVVEIYEELQRQTPISRRANAASNLERQLIWAIAKYHAEEGLLNLGVSQKKVSAAVPVLSLVP